MSTTSPAAAPKLLVYEQIAANERRVRWLLLCFGLALLPFSLWIAHQITAYLVLLVLPIVVGWETILDDPALSIAIATFLAVQITALAAYVASVGAARGILRTAGARALTAEEVPELTRMVENLCIGSGLPEPQLALLDSSAINAFSTGLAPETSTLVVTRGAVAALERRELEAVVAHEIVQIASRDARLGTVVAGLVRFMWIPLVILGGLFGAIARLIRAVTGSPGAGRGCLIVLAVWLGLPVIGSLVFGVSLAMDMLRDDLQTGLLLLALMLLPLYVTVVTPVAGLLMLRAISRERVGRADANALLLTRNPGGLARAFAKMSVAGNAAVATTAAMRHLWVSDPQEGLPDGWARITASHPPLEERLATLAGMSGVTTGEVEEARAAGVRFARRGTG